jgi:hypothetical protein
VGIAVKTSILGSDGRDSKPAPDMEDTVNYHNVPNIRGSVMRLLAMEIQELGRRFLGLKAEPVKKIREICSKKSILHIKHIYSKKAVPR